MSDLNSIEKQKIIEEFKRRKKKMIVISIGLLPFFIIYLILSDNPGLVPCPLGLLFMLFFIFILLPVIVFSFITWRCPACNALFTESINPSFCYKCRAQLRENVGIQPPDPESHQGGFFKFDRETSLYQLQEAMPTLMLILVGIIAGIIFALLKK